MTLGKRLLDIGLALVLAIVMALPFGLLLLWLWWREGRPLFYVSERMRGLDRPFWLWKLRTMSVVPPEQGVSGGDKRSRVTRIGAFLRSGRLDEVPQLWNVLTGDMSFVGPRPPLRLYVERYPEIYAHVLKSRPGITGLATLMFHRHEARILAACQTPEETDVVYSRRFVKRKARIDLIYQRNQSTVFDILILFQTFVRAFF